jgi:hypothetical protein
LESGLGGSWYNENLKTADFTVYGVTAARPRRLMFVHEGLRLAGSREVRGDEQGPITIKLEPWATVTGRLITADGLPRADVDFYFAVAPLKQPNRPDKDGKFRLEGLVPGLRYGMGARVGTRVVGDVFRDLILRPGETKDLGDVQLKLQN